MQDTDATHHHQIDNHRPEDALFDVLYPLVGQGVLPLKLCSKHYLSSLPLSIFHRIAWL